MRECVYPAEESVMRHAQGKERWTVPAEVEELKEEAKRRGLWNLWITRDLDPGHDGAGLTNVDYAGLAEVLGAVPFASELVNCSAPDTGNMEVLLKYGSEELKRKFLPDLLSGKARSCFAMTEPAVASSDATNVQSTIRREGDRYVLNGRKWWTSGAMDPRCSVMIFMGKTDPSAPRHQQQSMVVVPMPSPGLRVLRPLRVFGFDDAPHGHAEVELKDVSVPASHLLLGEGRGFEIAQGRLGPGRIHHCMRLIGLAERSLALMCKRAKQRVAFGKKLEEQGTIRADIARARLMINQTRLLCLDAARAIDMGGPKAAREAIALIKVAAPQMAVWVTDRAMQQVHGAAGFCDDFPLSFLYAQARTLQMADGPDEVHLESIARMELNKHKQD
ncbi:hypothetical protein GUITHDRAFT_87673 [Guillardia theta CCMP2712]|uniref:Acyl-CoA dehydrogenase n=1 Tax=Guillardia theta (strain CCMP2712) TaxID=905079 RepID=L1J6Z8_GUITC|nr:hypothetical protein GUITHDRAFT_87673 [Guillardia theta CCMP2712]EKX43879.1 hypothetical protein GUITHDRAFT_87673 [Guillardia theta CCMP2712]|eukprot:XP_005830859.1 hypothetical protein GUITHDRAFT_87673 [Guillardia theta CCMP2712]